MSSVQRKTNRNFGKFLNYRQKSFMLFHIYKCRRFRKSHQKSEPELGIPAEWQHSKVSLWNVGKNTKNFKNAENQRNAIFIFMTFRNHRPTIFMLFHINKYRRFRKSHQKSEPELGMPAEWHHSKASLLVEIFSLMEFHITHNAVYIAVIVYHFTEFVPGIWNVMSTTAAFNQVNHNAFQHIADLSLFAFHDQHPVWNDTLHVFFSPSPYRHKMMESTSWAVLNIFSFFNELLLMQLSHVEE